MLISAEKFKKESTRLAFSRLVLVVIFVAAAVEFFAPKGASAVTLLQQATASSTNVTTATITLPAPPTAGSALILQTSNNLDYPSSVVGGGVTWAQAAFTCQHICLSTWYGLNSSGVSTTITMTYPESNHISAN